MISVIICSVNEPLLAAVKQNIDATIGVPYEVIAIDNRNSPAGICEVYNRGAAQARFELLCFMHEDIVIQTQNWGSIVADLLKPETGIGLAGVAGSYYKPLMPSGWNGSGGHTECIYIMQGSKGQHPDELQVWNVNPFGNKTAEVASIDGVWFCTTKAIATRCGFDAQTLKGFHGYDVDFSLSVGRHYKVVVTYEVLLAHLSEGSFNRTWLIETLKLHNKWKNHLPVKCGAISKRETTRIEKYTFRHFLWLLVKFNLPLSLAKEVLWQSAYRKKLSLNLWLNCNFHLYKYWKKALKNPAYNPTEIKG